MPRFKEDLKGAYTKEAKAERAAANEYLAQYDGINTEPPAFLSNSAKKFSSQPFRRPKKTT